MVSTSQWGSVERWGPTLLLIGGGLTVGHAALLGIQAFSNLTTPPDAFGPTGHLVALVSWAVMTVTRFLAVAGVVSPVSDVLPGVFFVLVFASTTSRTSCSASLLSVSTRVRRSSASSCWRRPP